MQPGRPSSLLDGIEGGAESHASAKGSGAAGSLGSLDAKSLAMLIGGGVILIVAGFLIFQSVTGLSSNLGAASRQRTAVDSETGKVFDRYQIKDGESWPWKNPSTGRSTLYPPEACFWTADGQAKLEPTLVILNSIMGKEGPTMCPDCGREVVAHNPLPPADLLLKAAERAKSGGN